MKCYLLSENTMTVALPEDLVWRWMTPAHMEHDGSERGPMV